MEFVLGNNPGLKTLQHVGKILLGEEENLPAGMTITDVSNLKYTPVVSADVERSFSMYKLFRDNRHKFTTENLSKRFVTHTVS